MANISSDKMAKGSPEEELEKQYRDYRAQFEQWKEKNKSSAGTPAYIQYVEQFRMWEADVEKRRLLIRKSRSGAADQQKTTTITPASSNIQHQRAAAKPTIIESSTAPSIYHQSATNYGQQQRPPIQHSQYQQQHYNPSIIASDTDSQQPMNPMALMMSVMSMMMGDGSSELPDSSTFHAPPPHGIARSTVDGSQLPPIPTADYGSGIHHPSSSSSSAQLWGTPRVTYGPQDDLFRRWASRATPPNHPMPYRPPPPSMHVPPGWMVTEAMKKERMVIAPQTNVPPPPIMPHFTV